MQTLLLMISLLLHLITFVIIRSQGEKMMEVKNREAEIRQQAHEVEAVLSTYLFEIKEDNDRVINELRFTAREEPVHTRHRPDQPDKTKQEENSGEGVLHEKKDGNLPIKEKDYSDLETLPVYMPPLTSTEKDVFEQSVSGKAYSLYKEGKSVESIAKELNCGKTEIELMLKFRQKN